MERIEVLEWLTSHPQEVHDSAEDILSRCEKSVHDHVTEETWQRARDVARQRERYWRDDGGGAHASEAFVAREVCSELASELRRLEQIPEVRDVGAYVEPSSLTPLGAAGRSLLLRYVIELARREEHETWLEVMDFTRRRGLDLAHQRTFSTRLDFERTHGYAETAARVMHILADDYERHAHPNAR